jgi:hypothetical protein
MIEAKAEMVVDKILRVQHQHPFFNDLASYDIVGLPFQIHGDRGGTSTKILVSLTRDLPLQYLW